MKGFTEQPDWMPSKGHWRLLQVLRFGLAMPLLMIGMIVVSFGKPAYGVAYIFWAIVAFAVITGVAWAICWTRSGFSDDKKD